MTLDQRITHAAARVAIAWGNMDEQQAQEWQAEVDRLMDARDHADRLSESIGRLERRATFDETPTAAERTVARLDGYTQEQHQAGIRAALERLAKRHDRQARARAAVALLSGLSEAEVDEVGGIPCDTFDILKGSPDHSVVGHA